MVWWFEHKLDMEVEGFTPNRPKPPNRSPCSNSTDTKFDNIFLRIELWILYVSKRLVQNLLSKFPWLVNCRALQIFAASAPRRALALYPGAEISIIPGGSPTRLARWRSSSRQLRQEKSSSSSASNQFRSTIITSVGLKFEALSKTIS